MQLTQLSCAFFSCDMICGREEPNSQERPAKITPAPGRTNRYVRHGRALCRPCSPSAPFQRAAGTPRAPLLLEVFPRPPAILEGRLHSPRSARPSPFSSALLLSFPLLNFFPSTSPLPPPARIRCSSTENVSSPRNSYQGPKSCQKLGRGYEPWGAGAPTGLQQTTAGFVLPNALQGQ